MALEWPREALSTASARAAAAGLLLFQRCWTAGFHVRIGVHCGRVAWTADPGELVGPEIERAWQLERDAPPDSVLASDDVIALAPATFRDGSAYLGTTLRDGTPAYVYPRAAAKRADAASFVPASQDPEPRRQAFLAHVTDVNVRRLRYVGFRLHKRQPPSLDLLEVFTPLAVDVRKPVAAERLVVAAAAAGLPEGVRIEAVPTETRAFVDVFRDERHLVVLGDPGAGKSTLLKWLAVVASRGRAECRRRLGVDERLLPVLASIGRLWEIQKELHGDGKGPESFPGLLDALVRHLRERSAGGTADEIRDLLTRELAAGTVLLLLDGLDEVPSHERPRVASWIEAFLSAHSGNRAVVTSRVVGFGGLEMPDCEVVTVRPLDDAQVATFLRSWFRTYLAWESDLKGEAASRVHPQADAEAGQLVQTLKADERLAEMARNPLLLSMVALVHRAEGQLPAHRVQLYDIVTRALCETWSAARRTAVPATPGTAPRIEYETEAIPVLGALAFWMHEHHPTGVAPRVEVRRELASELIAHRNLEEAEADRSADEFLRMASEDLGLFVPKGPDAFGFLHLGFQEFLAAQFLLSQERFEEEMRRRWWDPRWLHVMLLGVGALILVQHRPRAAGLIVEDLLRAWDVPGHPWVREMTARHIVLAALLCIEVPGIPDAAQHAVAEELVRVWRSGRSGEVLATVWPRAWQSPLGTLHLSSLGLTWTPGPGPWGVLRSPGGSRAIGVFATTDEIFGPLHIEESGGALWLRLTRGPAWGYAESALRPSHRALIAAAQERGPRSAPDLIAARDGSFVTELLVDDLLWHVAALIPSTAAS